MVQSQSRLFYRYDSPHGCSAQLYVESSFGQSDAYLPLLGMGITTGINLSQLAV